MDKDSDEFYKVFIFWRRKRDSLYNHAPEIKKFIWPNQEEGTKKNEFSIIESVHLNESFIKHMGQNNFINTIGLDDCKILERIFYFLVNNRAYYYYKNYESYFFKLLTNTYGFLIYDKNSNYDDNLSYGTFIDLFSDLTKQSKLDSLATLAHLINLDFTNLYEYKRFYSSLGINFDDIKYYIPKEIFLYYYPDDSCTAFLLKIYEIYWNNKEIMGGIAVYNYNGKEFCLPLAICENRLVLGEKPPVALFLNQNKFEQYPQAKIILFQDMRTALKMQADC